MGCGCGGSAAPKLILNGKEVERHSQHPSQAPGVPTLKRHPMPPTAPGERAPQRV